jgi:hypothetical protein
VVCEGIAAPSLHEGTASFAAALRDQSESSRFIRLTGRRKRLMPDRKSTRRTTTVRESEQNVQSRERPNPGAARFSGLSARIDRRSRSPVLPNRVAHAVARVQVSWRFVCSSASGPAQSRRGTRVRRAPRPRVATVIRGVFPRTTGPRSDLTVTLHQSNASLMPAPASRKRERPESTRPNAQFRSRRAQPARTERLDQQAPSPWEI